MMSVDEGLKILQGLLTPVIGIITAYIAWQQWRTNRDKLKLDRYERRLLVYEEVVRFISVGIRKANYSDEDLMAFRPKVSEADFMFGEDVSEYIDKLYFRAVQLHYWNGEYRDYSQPKPEGYDHDKVVKGMHEELKWMSSQLEPARKLFKKYLDVSR